MRQLGARLPDAPIEPSRTAPANLEAVPPRESVPWGMLDDEDDGSRPRSPFLTLAVPAVAAVLALGALFWSGSMRDRLRHQDDVMTTLQQQNQKLADTMEEMTVEQKASSAVKSSQQSTTQRDLDTRAADVARQQRQLAAAQRQQQNSQPAPAQNAPRQETQPPDTQPSDTQRGSKQASATQPKDTRAQDARDMQSRSEMVRPQRQAEVASAPQIVPPYPTNYSAKSVAGNIAGNVSGTASQPAQQPSAVASARPEAGSSMARPSTTTAGSTATSSTPAVSVSTPRAATASGVTSRPAPQTSLAPASSAASGQYYSQGNAAYASPLAQNIEAVEALQRHSTVPLQEFHVHEGMLTRVTPALGLSVKHAEDHGGTYSLVVYAGKDSYQLKGQVNNPLVFRDNGTQREYELVVMRIASQQIYGYVRAMR